MEPSNALKEIIHNNPQVKSTLDNYDYWNLNSGKFTTLWMQIFEELNKVECEELWLDQNQNKDIVEHLLPIRFPNLKFLCLANNNIVSIEAFIYLRAPSLEELNLDSNNLVHLRSLRKCHFPVLEYLSIADNHIKELGCLSQKAAKIERLDLEYVNSIVTGQDLGWIVKLRSSDMRKIYIESNHRIINPALNQIILAKYGNVQIYDRENV